MHISAPLLVNALHPFMLCLQTKKGSSAILKLPIDPHNKNNVLLLVNRIKSRYAGVERTSQPHESPFKATFLFGDYHIKPTSEL